MLILTDVESAEFKERIPENKLLVLLKPKESVTQIVLNNKTYDVYSNRVLPDEYRKQGYKRVKLLLQMPS